MQEAYLELLNIEDDWSEFLSILEASEPNTEEGSTPQVGDKIASDLILYRVRDVLSTEADPSSAPHGTSVKIFTGITLADLLQSTARSVTLLVLNRHFA